MNNDQIKEILLSIEETDIDFTVTMSGKESKKVNGLYKPDNHEIILHNLNFKSDNQLIYTAIHEYTHHLVTVEQEKMTKGFVKKILVATQTNFGQNFTVCWKLPKKKVCM